MIVDGVVIDSQDEVRILVRKQLEVGNVWIKKHDHRDIDGLKRAVRNSGDLRPAFARAIYELLSEDEKKIRSAGVAMLPEVAEEIGARALVDLLDAHPGLYYRVKPSRKYPLHYDDLAGAILVAIGRFTEPGDSRSIEVLREAAQGAHAREVVSSLSRVDADWLCDNASLVPRDTLGAVLLNLSNAEHRESLVRALSPWPESEREEVLKKRYWDMLDADRAEVEKLKRIIAGKIGC